MNTEKQKSLATLTLPYHSSMKRLKTRLSEIGIRMDFSSNCSLHSLLRRRTTAPSISSTAHDAVKSTLARQVGMLKHV